MCRVFLVLAAVCALAYGSHVRLQAPRLDGRIVGGRDTNIEELPYQLSLQYSGSHICGASIISADWALTAAHCVLGASAARVSLRAGSSTRGGGGTVHQAKQVIVHPNYNDSWVIDYDYALIKVQAPFHVGSAGVQPIPLAEAEPAGGDAATTSGWGALSAGGGSPRQLQSVQLPVVARDACQAAYRHHDITGRMVCAGWLGVGGKDACQGDSGGPLAAGGRLVGVVSWGIGCARPDYPGVFSNVADQRAWIREQTGV